jgi:hypothetical protein
VEQGGSPTPGHHVLHHGFRVSVPARCVRKMPETGKGFASTNGWVMVLLPVEKWSDSDACRVPMKIYRWQGKFLTTLLRWVPMGWKYADRRREELCMPLFFAANALLVPDLRKLLRALNS